MRKYWIIAWALWVLLSSITSLAHADGIPPNWKDVQPKYPGPYQFGAELPSFPKLVVPFNLEQERRQKADAISWGTTIRKQWGEWETFDHA
jgi:hypothetical protein